MSTNPMIAYAESLVKEHMAKYDPSHDWWHVNRVRNTALKLSRSQEGSVDPVVLELLALFHDLHDAKYAAAGGPTLEQTLQPFFSHPDVSVSAPQQTMILKLIPLISWSTEKKLRADGQWDAHERELREQGGWNELCCAQDADRLDAVGALGIMRCAAYSAAVGRALHIPARGSSHMTREMMKATAIGHFHDKLLHIRDRMKTEKGKEEAEKRHQTMLHFLQAIDDELA